MHMTICGLQDVSYFKNLEEFTSTMFRNFGRMERTKAFVAALPTFAIEQAVRVRASHTIFADVTVVDTPTALRRREEMFGGFFFVFF